MEFQQLRYFVAVAEERSFSRAAERMRVAQPSLSQQMQKLENNVGHLLFDRLPRGVTLTEVGRQLLPFARQVLSDLSDAQRCVDEFAKEASGTVGFGIIPTIAPYLLQKILARTAEKLPKVTVRVTEDLTEVLVRGLDEGELDLAVASTCRTGPGVHKETWGEEPMILVVPTWHRLANRRTATWRDLQGESLLIPKESHCLSRQIARWCDRHGIQSRLKVNASQLSTIVTLVVTGRHLSLLLAMAVEEERRPGCAFVAIRGDKPEREINIIRNPARFWSKATSAVAQITGEVIRESTMQNVGIHHGEHREHGERRNKDYTDLAD
jgi:LysR family hydrogen peroxide-inducible transcriptional activator